MAEAEDWRLTTLGAVLRCKLAGMTLMWVDWHAPRPGWDHDHCAFCWTKFAGPETPDTLHAGYATLDRYYWICAQCFADFREVFEWQVVDSVGLANRADS
jgi:hypothetical protein